MMSTSEAEVHAVAARGVGARGRGRGAARGSGGRAQAKAAGQARQESRLPEGLPLFGFQYAGLQSPVLVHRPEGEASSHEYLISPLGRSACKISGMQHVGYGERNSHMVQ